MTATTAVSPGRFGRLPSRDRMVSSTRMVVALGAIAVAYHYSLLSIIENLKLDSPLAYLGLVPFIALALALARGRAAGAEPDIHDRHLDYIVGIPLLAAALGAMVLLPVRMSSQFWTWRMDLLTLPLFVAGTIAVAFGVRTLWRVRVAVAFLALAWPVPYMTVIDRWLDRFTDLTIAAIKGLVDIVPVASAAGGDDGSLFAVNHAGESFVVSVASACSGANGMVGFLLIGVAFASLIRGRRGPKLLWLASGMVLLWATNLGRILLVFAVGERWGEDAAIEGFHPYIGLVLFSLGVVAMILSMPLFGLRFRWGPGSGSTTAISPAPAAGSRVMRAVPRARLSLSIVVLAGAILAVSNAGLRQFDLVADDLGKPRLVSFSDVQGRPAGWSIAQTDHYDWARRFFGTDSTWNRYAYSGSDAATQLRSSVPVFADVISSSSLRPFSVYGLEACYTFHGYTVKDARSVDIGGGISANAVSYYHPGLQADWTTLYWHWPVRAGDETRYERVVLMMINANDAQLTSPPLEANISRQLGLAIDNASRDRERDGVDERLARTREFLVGFAQSVVLDQSARSATAPGTVTS